MSHPDEALPGDVEKAINGVTEAETGESELATLRAAIRSALTAAEARGAARERERVVSEIAAEVYRDSVSSNPDGVVWPGEIDSILERAKSRSQRTEGEA